MDENIYIGKNLVFLLTEKNMTQVELSKILGKTTTSVNSWITRGVMPQVSDLIKISDLFCISIDELVNYDLFNIDSYYASDILEKLLNSRIMKKEFDCENTDEDLDDLLTIFNLFYKKKKK